MIEPVAFGFNTETATNNHFQQNDEASSDEIQAMALKEFKAMTQLLQNAGVHVIVVKDTANPHTPDSIFPNNWISFHQNRKIALYPMYAKNRRLERRLDFIQKVKDAGFNYSSVTNYAINETEDLYLEGTGSMILDRENRIAYGALSDRLNKKLFEQFSADFNFTPISFSAFQSVGAERLPIYHTNVLMAIAEKYAVICLQSIDNLNERRLVINTLEKTGKEIIEISEQQMHHFAGNMLQVKNKEGKKYLVMSNAAYQVLSEEQRKKLGSFNELIIPAVPTIEKYGGGSVRCMMAEVF